MITSMPPNPKQANTRNILCLLLARQGSQGLRHKNIATINDIPLLARAVTLAQQSAQIRTAVNHNSVNAGAASNYKGAHLKNNLRDNLRDNAEESPRKENWRCLVSSDSPRYNEIASRAGAFTLLRPAHLATAHSPMIESVIHAVLEAHTVLGEDWLPQNISAVLLISVTTPLTLPSDVCGLVELFFKSQLKKAENLKRDRQDIDALKQHPGIASVKLDDTDPSWRFYLTDEHLLPTSPNQQQVTQRQGQEGRESLQHQASQQNQPEGNAGVGPVFILNGALYMATPQWLMTHNRFVVAGHSLGYTMPRSRSLDIECQAHLDYARFLLR